MCGHRKHALVLAGVLLPALPAQAQAQAAAAGAVAPAAIAPAADTTTAVSATLEAGPKKQWQASASAQYRQLAISDPDPANDRVVLWSLGGSVGVFKGGKVFLRFGMSERFVAEGAESGFKLRDSAIGLSYGHELPFDDAGNDKLSFSHKLAFFLPTSRASLAQDLYVAPQYVLALSYELVHGLTVVFSPDARYRWHQYAERAGYDGVMNVQWELNAHGGLDWTFLESARFGNLGIGGSAGSGWQRKYPSRDDHTSTRADTAVWSQSYDWEAHVGYDPVPFLSLGVGLEHGGSVLRDGIVNTFLTHRDETELAFTVSGTY